MTDAIQMGIGMLAIVSVFKIITDTMTRHRLINKGLVDEKVKYLFSEQYKMQPLSNLKWGMVLVGIGLALLIREFLPYRIDDETMFGLMFIFAGIGFLIYYRLAKERLRNLSNESRQP